jgi:hypothetical protein
MEMKFLQDHFLNKNYKRAKIRKKSSSGPGRGVRGAQHIVKFCLAAVG